MLEISGRLQIPEQELTWTYVRSSGPGGQNVNKVASKAVLRWNLAANTSLPEEVKMRLRGQQRRRVTVEGEMVLTSQRYRDQERNRLDCLEKLRAFVLQALEVPRPRRPTQPTRSSQRRRLTDKRQHSEIKSIRRSIGEE